MAATPTPLPTLPTFTTSSSCATGCIAGVTLAAIFGFILLSTLAAAILHKVFPRDAHENEHHKKMAAASDEENGSHEPMSSQPASNPA